MSSPPLPALLSACEPDNTAVRTALWRALHLLADPPPHVFSDAVGLQLIAPEDGWRERPDMSEFTRPFRASIVARARFVEDQVDDAVRAGIAQYVILGAGLDTFALRRADLAAQLRVFEVDQPRAVAWKQQRLVDTGLGQPANLRFVPGDFEHDPNWITRLRDAGFDPTRPAIVASTGVSMYLTHEAIAHTLREVASLPGGSRLIMSFMLPFDLLPADIRPGVERAAAGARANGTPFVSFFTPEAMLRLASESGFRSVEHISATELGERYFAGRTDGLRPPPNSEELLIATV